VSAVPVSATRRLCICADDFGMDSGINRAVLALAARGKLSATSCMVGRAAWAEGARGLRGAAAPSIDVGLHLDLTPARDAGGREPGLAPLIARSYLRLLPAARLRAEIDAQLDRFEDAMDRPPDFIDGHRHVHQLPGVRDALVEAVARRYRAAPPWLRSTRPAARAHAGSAKEQLIFALGGAATRRLARSHGVPMGRGLLGVYGFDGDIDDYRRRLRDWLARCRTGDVLMCHPSAGLAASDPIGAARLREYQALGEIDYPFATETGEVVLGPVPRQPEQPALP
jgi:chitin disaccharide deacetylase